MGKLFKATGLKRSFGLGMPVVSVDLTMDRGETVCLLSRKAGLGEETLLNLISGWLDPEAGYIEFKGQNITRLPPLERTKMGLVRAYAESQLFNDLTVADHILAVSRNLVESENDLYAQWNNDGVYLRKGMRRLAEVGLHVGLNAVVGQLDPVQKMLLGLGLATLESFDMLLWPLDSLPRLKDQNLENIQYILGELANDGKALLLVSTDAGLARDVSTNIYQLKNGLLNDQTALLTD